jgi:hypothetical protein
MNTSNIRNNAVCDLILIEMTVARFVVTGSFFDILSDIRNKHIAGKSQIDLFVFLVT